MPLDRTSYRFSYLQQTDYSSSTQLLAWLKLAQETIDKNEQSINQLIVVIVVSFTITNSKIVLI